MALQPPEQVAEELERFLEVRPSMPWINPEQWHVTLAFLKSVPEWLVDDLADRLERGFERKVAPVVRLDGAGSFPHPDNARVLWMRPVRLEGGGATLAELSVTARNAANKVGATPDGQKFVPHLTVARLRRGIDANRWIQVLDLFRSEPWLVDSATLIASHLGEGPSGRPRYERVAHFHLKSPSPAAYPGVT